MLDLAPPGGAAITVVRTSTIPAPARRQLIANILIVDDLAANRTLLATLLRHQGHDPIEVADGSQALVSIRAERPDLVMTDVLMPSMDGFELVRRLRLDPHTSGIPVVFCTAHYGGSEARALARSSGVAAVLIKPLVATEVWRIVEQALAAPRPAVPPDDGESLPAQFDRRHLRLVTDKLSATTEDLQAANQRLRALIEIGLELASEQDDTLPLGKVVAAARELFGATYVTLGIVDPQDHRLRHLASCGTDGPAWITAGEAAPGLLATVIAERRTVRGENPRGDAAALQLPVGHPPVHAYLAAPVASPAQVYGWIFIVANDGAAFTEEDEQLATALAAQAGRIYESSCASAAVLERAEELEHQVAERRLAEAAVARERDRAQHYLDAAEVFLISLDLDGRVLLANRYASETLEWAAGELVGRDWAETCVPARARNEVRQRLQTLIGGGEPAGGANFVVTRTGEERLVDWRNRVVRDDNGRVVGTFSSGADTTERHRAGEARRVADERARFALEAAGVGIWDMDFPSGVLEWSDILQRQYGFEPGTFAGTFAAFVDRIHPLDREAALATLAEANRSGSDFTVHNRALWPDGTVRWLSGAGRVHLDALGNPARGVGISIDTTDRHLLEEQYQQAQKMEAIGRLAGGVAHDFNNLLAAILGGCELLLSDLGADDPHRADVAEIQKAGTTAAALTRQLLAFSRKQIVAPTELDLNVVVAEMRAMLQRLIRENIRIEMRLSPGEARVTADRTQVEQILLNLAVNARDAMPDGGTLTVETAAAAACACESGTELEGRPCVVLTVTDTGLGMPAEVLARVLEPFFTTKGPGQGTGLGLATVHAIATQGGGCVRVSSTVDAGTCVRVYLPRCDQGRPAPAEPTLGPRPRGNGETVLLVEDAEGLRHLAVRLLERLGYTVLAAPSAEAATTLFDEHAVDLLLTDVVMPGASGPELARRLLERRPSLKVLYISGYTEDAIGQDGLARGIGFLHKPFTADELGRKIQQVLHD